MNENRTYAILGIVALLIALFTAGFRGRLLLTPPKTPSSIPPSASPRPSREIMEAEIRMVVEQGDQAEIAALSSGETEGLERYFTGEALKRERKVVEDLVDAGHLQDSTLHKITFNNIVIDSQGNTATVYVTERWSHKTRDAETGETLSETLATDQPQTVSLICTSADGWRVTAISWERNEPDPTPTPEPTPVPTPEPTQQSGYTSASSYTERQIQARYNERAAAFARNDLDGYFAYTLPEWTWHSEDGDRSSRSESREYYRKIFESGKARSLETRILHTYQVNADMVATEVLIATLRSGDEARLIRQLDIWVRRDGEWYCLAEKRLARTGTFPLSELATLIDEH